MPATANATLITVEIHSVDKDAAGIVTGTFVQVGLVKTGFKNDANGCKISSPNSAYEPTKPPTTESTDKIIIGTVMIAGDS